MEVKNAESAVLPCAVSWTGVGEKFSKSKNQKKKEKFFLNVKLSYPHLQNKIFFQMLKNFLSPHFWRIVLSPHFLVVTSHLNVPVQYTWGVRINIGLQQCGSFESDHAPNRAGPFP
jgi:hypothetical protein